MIRGMKYRVKEGHVFYHETLGAIHPGEEFEASPDSSSVRKRAWQLEQVAPKPKPKKKAAKRKPKK